LNSHAAVSLAAWKSVVCIDRFENGFFMSMCHVWLQAAQQACGVDLTSDRERYDPF